MYHMYGSTYVGQCKSAAVYIRPGGGERRKILFFGGKKPIIFSLLLEEEREKERVSHGKKKDKVG